MRRAAPFAILLALPACTAGTPDEIARGAAKSAVNRVVLERYPGLPVEPVIDCVIDNATSEQLYALAADSLGGTTAATGEIVAGILQKPETVRCLGEGLAVAMVRR